MKNTENTIKKYTKIINLDNLVEGVCYDPDNITIQGYYKDELSLARAKKLWRETLTNSLMLAHHYDYQLTAEADYKNSIFILVCNFLTTAARYSFWKIVHDQAPEIQYVLETAHIPICDSRHADIVSAPDLSSIYESPNMLDSLKEKYNKKKSQSLSRWLKDFLSETEV